MDISSLSLAEIATLLSPKEQNILLASISIASHMIQQLKDEEPARQQQQQQIQQHHHQQQQQHLSYQSSDEDGLQTSTHVDSRLYTSHEDDYEDDDEDNDDEEDEDASETDHSHFMNHHTHHSTSKPQYTDREDHHAIKRFADELKSRRKAIRLSQKGAAQSLRAFTNGDQPCTDAIIYHFENLQLEPDRAMQLIPLLTDWLEWAEKHRLNNKSLPMMAAVTKVPRERKRKVVLFSEKAKQYLEDAFLKNNHPDRYQLDVISQELNIPTRSIRKWFTNRRQRKRFAEKFSSKIPE